MIAKQSKSATKDPICGMTVDQATALHAERDGKTFHFCSDRCKTKFLATPAGAKPNAAPESCCSKRGAASSSAAQLHDATARRGYQLCEIDCRGDRPPAKC